MHQVKGDIWYEFEGSKLSNHTILELLHHIHESGSLRSAAKSAQVSYSFAWQSINRLNVSHHHPLVQFRRGGKDGGSAHLTEAGQTIMAELEYVQRSFDYFLQKQNSKNLSM